MNRVKDNTMSFIIDEAIKLFLEKSITSVTMSDIAKKVGIGEATLYRYFQKKQNIVIQASSRLASKVGSEYFQLKETENGFDQIKAFYDAYPSLFKNHPEYFKFIDELDAYIITEDVSEKSEYEDSVNFYKDIFDKIYAKGIEDKTIKPVQDPDTFYYSTTHSLLNLCKFLSTKAVLDHDNAINKQKEIELLTDIILSAIKEAR